VSKERGPLQVDLYKFRIYLKDKYKIKEAYYFLGYVSEEQQDLYDNLKKAGFITLFKEHSPNLKGEKKGNVDTDIVFEIMKNLIDNKDFNKVILVSGDGDYKKVIDYFLIKKNKFKKILFPNKKFASSLYNSLSNELFDSLDRSDIRMKLEYNKNRK
jgi:uncharacterized LabA/DUF88 family protein